MVEVFFRGYGTWKILEDNSVWEPISDYYEACGYFCLLPRDEKHYLLTNSTKEISLLCASTQPDSEFSIMVKEGRLDSQLTKHSDNDFFKRERRGDFDNDLEKAQQLHQEEKAAEFLELARLAIFHIDKRKELFFDPEKCREPSNIENHSYLDTTHPMFSEELSIAIQAWNAVLKCNPDRPKSGSRRQLLENWLETHHSKLSNEAKNRIVTLLNPDKKGGVYPSA